MMRGLSEALVFAGPNGAGKSTFAALYLADRPMIRFINADDILRRRAFLAATNGAAAREMIRQVRICVALGESFAIETTLAGTSWARSIPSWRRSGYFVSLHYIRLPDVEMSINRVKNRVANGGHDIPEADIRRRFKRSWRNFTDQFAPIVDICL